MLCVPSRTHHNHGKTIAGGADRSTTKSLFESAGGPGQAQDSDNIDNNEQVETQPKTM